MNNIKNPKILQIDLSGIPQSWLDVEEAIKHYAMNSVVFELGNPIATYRGGFNRITNQQSVITANSIIAVRGDKSRPFDFQRTPNLTNETLFERDRYVCAYCGDVFHYRDLSRDHITPKKLGGKDVWQNVVTACIPCNTKKGHKTLEQANMKLLYLPYTPDLFENFILKQGVRKIQSDQMEYLLSKVSQKSRIRELLAA